MGLASAAVLWSHTPPSDPVAALALVPRSAGHSCGAPHVPVLITALEDGTIVSWGFVSRNTLEPLFVAAGHAAHPSAVTVAAVHRLPAVIVAYEDGTVVSLDLTDLHCLAYAPHLTGASVVKLVPLAAVENSVLICDARGRLHVLCTATLELRYSLHGHSGPITDAVSIPSLWVGTPSQIPGYAGVWPRAVGGDATHSGDDGSSPSHTSATAADAQRSRAASDAAPLVEHGPVDLLTLGYDQTMRVWAMTDTVPESRTFMTAVDTLPQEWLQTGEHASCAVCPVERTVVIAGAREVRAFALRSEETLWKISIPLVNDSIMRVHFPDGSGRCVLWTKTGALVALAPADDAAGVRVAERADAPGSVRGELAAAAGRVVAAPLDGNVRRARATLFSVADGVLGYATAVLHWPTAQYDKGPSTRRLAWETHGRVTALAVTRHGSGGPANALVAAGTQGGTIVLAPLYAHSGGGARTNPRDTESVLDGGHRGLAIASLWFLRCGAASGTDAATAQRGQLRLFSAASDGSLCLWCCERRQRLARFVHHTGLVATLDRVLALRIPDAPSFARSDSSASDATHTPTPLSRSASAAAKVNSPASPGTTVRAAAAALRSGTVFPPASAAAESVLDGLVFSTGADAAATLIDAANGRALAFLPNLPAPAAAMLWDVDAGIIVVECVSGSTVIVDAATMREIRRTPPSRRLSQTADDMLRSSAPRLGEAATPIGENIRASVIARNSIALTTPLDGADALRKLFCADMDVHHISAGVAVVAAPPAARPAPWVAAPVPRTSASPTVSPLLAALNLLTIADLQDRTDSAYAQVLSIASPLLLADLVLKAPPTVQQAARRVLRHLVATHGTPVTAALTERLEALMPRGQNPWRWERGAGPHTVLYNAPLHALAAGPPADGKALLAVAALAGAAATMRGGALTAVPSAVARFAFERLSAVVVRATNSSPPTCLQFARVAAGVAWHLRDEFAKAADDSGHDMDTLVAAADRLVRAVLSVGAAATIRIASTATSASSSSVSTSAKLLAVSDATAAATIDDLDDTAELQHDHDSDSAGSWLRPSPSTLRRHATRCLSMLGAAAPCVLASAASCAARDRSANPVSQAFAVDSITRLVRLHPAAVAPFLESIVASVVRCLDPDIPGMRDACLYPATRALRSLTYGFSPVSLHLERQRCAVGARRGGIIVHDLRSTAVLHRATTDRKQVHALEFCSNGTRIASFAADEGFIRVLRLPSGGIMSLFSGSGSVSEEKIDVPVSNPAILQLNMTALRNAAGDDYDLDDDAFDDGPDDGTSTPQRLPSGSTAWVGDAKAADYYASGTQSPALAGSVSPDHRSLQRAESAMRRKAHISWQVLALQKFQVHWAGENAVALSSAGSLAGCVTTTL